MQFTLKAHSDAAGVVALRVDAPSADEARRQAEAMGYLVFGVNAGSRSPSSAAAQRLRGGGFSLLLFSQQLLSLLDAGLNLVEAIEALAEKDAGSTTHEVLSQLIVELHSGQACSVAMARQPATFPAFYVATIRASERSGDVAQSLRRYVAYQTQIEEVRKRVSSAMIYPAVLLAAGALVTLFLLGYVVPRFSHLFDERVTDLPYLSRLLMRWGELVNQHGWTMLALAALLVVAVASALTHPLARQRIRQGLWALPGVGEQIRVYQLARLYRTLGMLLRGGTPAVAAMELVPGLLSQALQAQLQRAVQRVREGQSLSQALGDAGLTTPVAQRMLRVGEQSGQMADMMERAASFHDDEVARAIDVFTKVFEPALMVVIGAVVGGIVILMYLPIFELAGSVQ